MAQGLHATAALHAHLAIDPEVEQYGPRLLKELTDHGRRELASRANHDGWDAHGLCPSGEVYIRRGMVAGGSEDLAHAVEDHVVAGVVEDRVHHAQLELLR